MLSGRSLTASSPSVSFGENGGQIRVCVDKRSGSDTGAISESNEVNNCSPWTTVTTTTTPPPYDPTRYPDLVASATAPTTAVANVAQTYTSIISNIGAVTTGTSPNFFFQKSDLTYGTVDLPFFHSLPRRCCPDSL